MSNHLPLELIQDIFTRLPIRTLLRCTIVCKPWYSLITSPSFTSLHLKLSLYNNQHRVLVKFCADSRSTDSETGRGEVTETEHYHVHRDNQIFEGIEKLECPLTTWSFHSKIIASFNGLYCIYAFDRSYKERLILWNPSLRKSNTLPDPRVLYKSYVAYTHAIGFGFLPETNDYKIVRVVYLDTNDGYKIPPEVEIYKYSTGTWSDVDAHDCSYVIDERASQGFLNNSVHWGAFSRNGGYDYRVVVAFDMKKEKFNALLVPKILQSRSFSVSTFRDSLCLIQVPSCAWRPNLDKICSIWSMTEYGVETSWVKQFNIDARQFDSSLKPIFYRENGDILLAEKSNLLSYDPKSKKAVNIGSWKEARPLYVDTFRESLVLINASNDVLSRVTAEMVGQSAERSGLEERFSQLICSSN